MNEFRTLFNHFDRDENGVLDGEEIKGLMISLGKGANPDTPQGKQEINKIMAIVDPNNTGTITFQSFIDYMTIETTDHDTAEQIIESFRVLSGDKPYILPDELRRELPEDEAEYCISRMAPWEGEGPEDALDYHSFASSLYGAGD